MERLIALVVLLVVGTFIGFGKPLFGLAVAVSSFLAILYFVVIDMLTPAIKRVHMSMSQYWYDIPEIIRIAEKCGWDMDMEKSVHSLYVFLEYERKLFEIKVDEDVAADFKNRKFRSSESESVLNSRSQRLVVFYIEALENGDSEDLSNLKKAVLVRKRIKTDDDGTDIATAGT